MADYQTASNDVMHSQEEGKPPASLTWSVHKKHFRILRNLQKEGRYKQHQKYTQGYLGQGGGGIFLHSQAAPAASNPVFIPVCKI